MLRPITAEQRIAARYIPAGYTVYREIPGGIVYASPDKTRAIAYRGTAMNHTWNYRFHSEKQLNEEVEKFFDNIKSHIDYQATRKANRDKGETDTQKVKKALKAAGYPVTSVTRGKGTASHWIEIEIDDYQGKINDQGEMISQYGDVLWIAQVASGREHLHDDSQTDLFLVNITVNFKKWRGCNDCVVQCDRYRKDMGACGSFRSQAMVDLHYAIWCAPVFPPYINPDKYLFAEVA